MNEPRYLALGVIFHPSDDFPQKDWPKTIVYFKRVPITGELVCYNGDFYRVAAVTNVVNPPPQKGPPLLVADLLAIVSLEPYESGPEIELAKITMHSFNVAA